MPHRLVCISGARGAGKGTLVDTVLRYFPVMRRIVPHTTRAPRPGERDGHHYHFLSDGEFDRYRANGGLLCEFHIGGRQRSGLAIAEVEQTVLGVCDALPEAARMIRDYARGRGGDALLLGVFAPPEQRLARIRARACGDEREALRLFREDPVSGEARDYADFDRLIDNADEGNPELACTVAIHAVRTFLNGGQI